MPNDFESMLFDLTDPDKNNSLERSAFGVIKKVAVAKLSILTAAFCLYYGAKYHRTIERIEDFFLNHNAVVAESYFQDPRGLDYEITRNSNGEREVYLTYGDTRIAVMYDRFPPTDVMLDSLDARLQSNRCTDDKRQVVDRLRDMYLEHR